MVARVSRLSLLVGSVAMCALAAPPASALPQSASVQAGYQAQAPVPVMESWQVEQETAQRQRAWRGGGYGSWGRYRPYRRGASTGDVLAGMLIIGGIAAVLASTNRQDRARAPSRDYPAPPDRRARTPYPSAPYPYANPSRPSYAGGGLDRAADMCVSEVERDEAVQEVANVARVAAGWRVDGRLDNGRNFRCMVDNNGRVTSVDLDSSPYQPAAADIEDNQWADDAYTQARQEHDLAADTTDHYRE